MISPAEGGTVREARRRPHRHAVDIADIDSRRVFDYLDRLLEGFHHRVKFVRILEREIAAFHNTDIFAFRNAYEQVQLRSPDVKTEDVFFFSLFLFTVIH